MRPTPYPTGRSQQDAHGAILALKKEAGFPGVGQGDLLEKQTVHKTVHRTDQDLVMQLGHLFYHFGSMFLKISVQIKIILLAKSMFPYFVFPKMGGVFRNRDLK